MLTEYSSASRLKALLAGPEMRIVASNIARLSGALTRIACKRSTMAGTASVRLPELIIGPTSIHDGHVGGVLEIAPSFELSPQPRVIETREVVGVERSAHP
jgi:hypothetical protein